MTLTRGTQTESKWPRMTYEEYLRAPDIPEHTEWVNGEVVEMMSVSKAHVETQAFLLDRLFEFLRTNRIGRVYLEPFQMKVTPDANGRAPDIMVVRSENRGRVKDQFLDGPADLVIEIVSPGTEGIDRGEKFYEYERGGVTEYWIVDPHRQVAEFYVRDEHGVFRSANVPPDGEVESRALPGLRIRVDDLWHVDPDESESRSK